jgi:hypothetical protein
LYFGPRKNERIVEAAASNANSAIRRWGYSSSISNVTISGNYLLGGAYTLEIGPGSYPVSNISVANNYIGYWKYGEYYPGTQTSATLAGNTVVGYANPIFSTEALAA